MTPCQTCGGSEFVDSLNPEIPIKPCPDCTGKQPPAEPQAQDALAALNKEDSDD